MVKILPDSMDNPYEFDAFPSGYLPNTHEDKLFKHVVFHTNEDLSKLRVTAVGHDWTASTESMQKIVSLQTPTWNPEKDKVRIKAVMDTPVDGVVESDWIQQRYLNREEVQVVNQFRARGISKKGWKSKWVYSEARDQDNDLIAFELLHDLLDILLYTHDHDLEAVLDSAVTDTFINHLHHQSKKDLLYSYLYEFEESKRTQIQELFQIRGKEQETFDLMINAGISEESLAEIKKKVFQSNETKKASITELSKMVSHVLRKEFREVVHSSPMELADLAKTYKLFERFQTSHTDFAYLILESFLEDRYEKVIEEVNLEALLRNDEEMHSLLQSVYEFDLKSELIKHAYDLGLDDHFVTVLNDAVKLISEPIVYDKLKLGASEEIGKFLRLAFQEVFVPFLIMEKRLLEIDTPLTDTMTEKPKDRLLEFVTLHQEDDSDEEYLIRYLLLEEMFEMMLTDINITDNYHFELLDRIINMVNKERVALFIDYDPVEFIEIFSKISEDFKHGYMDFKKSVDEHVTTGITDTFDARKTKDKYAFKDAINSRMSESTQMNNQNLHSLNDEKLSAQFNEHVSHASKGQITLKEAFLLKTQELQVIMALLEESILEENKKINTQETLLSRDGTRNVREEITQRVALQMELLSKDTTLYKRIKESKRIGKRDLYEYVYNLNPLDHLLKVYLEFKEQHLDVDRLDNYFEIIWNMKDQVVVYLGELGGAWPLKTFSLGSATLKGDPTNPESGKLPDNQDPNQYI